MPRTEAAPPLELQPASPLFSTASVSGWGGGPEARLRMVQPSQPSEFPAALERARALEESQRGIIGRGMGRSYGDAAQLAQGYVIETTGCRRFELDAAAGVVTAEAGATMGELLR